MFREWNNNSSLNLTPLPDVLASTIPIWYRWSLPSAQNTISLSHKQSMREIWLLTVTVVMNVLDNLGSRGYTRIWSESSGILKQPAIIHDLDKHVVLLGQSNGAG